MAIIETTREDIKALKGVHLFHFATSNCSQRVRFVLEEKGVEWTSHHVDLTRSENATPEFVELNPRGVVPVLVHDGVTIVESNDIIEYVNENWDGPTLVPKRSTDRLFLHGALQRSSKFQATLKVLMYEFLFKPFRRMDGQQLDAYERGTRNPELVKFMRDFSSKEGFGDKRILGATREAKSLLDYLERRLNSRPWLTGDQFGLGDISWVVNLHRFAVMHYPLNEYPKVRNWLNRVRSRPAFKAAISDFEPSKMKIAFKVYSRLRRLRGTSIRHYLKMIEGPQKGNRV